VFLSTKWSIDSLTGSRDLRCATGFGRATSMPGLALSLSPPLSPQAHSSRTGAEWVCIYYFLFSFTLASVFLSTTCSIDILTESSDLMCATVFGRASSMLGVALSLSPAQPPGSLKQDRGRAGVYLFLENSTKGFLMFLICPLRVGLGLRCMLKFYDF